MPIFNTLYPGYEALFLFDNSDGHAAFSSDALRVQHMNLNPGGQQNVLRPGVFGDPQVVQSMVDHDGVPKGIKRVLEERGLWNDGLRLECPKPLCEVCESVKKCTSCKKRSKCDQCQLPKTCGGQCSKRRCGECVRRSTCRACVKRQKCQRCEALNTKKCKSCENLPPRCASEGIHPKTKHHLILITNKL